MSKVKDFILKQFETGRPRLGQLKLDIAEEFAFELKYSDVSYVEQTFIEIVLSLWRREVKEIIELAMENENLSDGEMIKVFMAFEANGFDNTPENFKNNTYQLIISEREVFQELDLPKVCNQILAFWNYAIRTKTRTMIREFEFFDSLLAVLRNSFKQFAQVVEKFQLEAFASGLLSMTELANCIVVSEFEIDGFEKLHMAALKLPDKKLSLGEKIQNAIKEYIMPAKVSTEVTFGKMTTTIIKKLMTMDELEFHPNSDVQEIDLICDIIHVDKNLPEQFRGINMAILSNHIVVHETSRWDLSGESQTHQYDLSAGQDVSGKGRDGANGFPGESSGNFAVFCRSIKNSSNWIIQSNGGSASSGQDAGNGLDGIDGRNTDKNDFSVNGKEFKIDYNSDNMAARFRIIGLKSWPRPKSDAIHRVERGMNKDVYYFWKWTKREGFMQVNGSPGSSGKTGGVGGYAAEGGYAGDQLIETADDQSEASVRKIAVPGQHGEIGDSGFNGLNGREGRDAWLHDFSWWRSPLYVGLDKNEKYRISNGKQDHCIWNHALNQYVYSEYYRNVSTSQRQRQRNNSTENQSHKINATKKSQVLMASIRKLHSAYLEGELETLSNLFEKFEAIDGITDETSISTGVRTSYQLQYTDEKNPTEVEDKDNDIGKKIEFEEIMKQFELAKSSSLIFENLRKAELKKEECLEVLEAAQPRLETDPKPTENELTSILQYESCFISHYISTMQEGFKLSFTDVVKLTYEKLKLKYWEEISEKIFTTDNKLSASESGQQWKNMTDYIPYLKQDGEKFNTGVENSFGNLDSFINDNYEYNTEIIVDSLKDATKTFNSSKSSYFEKIFLSLHKEFLDSDEIGSFMKDYKKQLDGLKDREENLPEVDPEKEEDPDREALYAEFSALWENFFTNDVTMSFIFERLSSQAIKSATFRLLLAIAFNVNWIVFLRDVDGILVLVENINDNLSSEKVYSIKKDDTFATLKFDNKKFELWQTRKIISRRCKYVLNTSFDLMDKNQMTEYFSNEKYFQKDAKMPELYDENLLGSQLLVSMILSYFSSLSPQGKSDLEMLLLNVSTLYPNSNNILKSINVRLFDEGRRVTANEFSTILTVVSKCILDPQMISYFEFLFLSTKQRDWLPEIIVLQVEDYLKHLAPEMKTSWLQLLKTMELTQFMIILSMKSQVKESTLTETDFDDLFKVMGYFSISSVENLLQTDLTLWKFTLTEQFWSTQLESLHQSEKLRESTHADAKLYFISLQSKFGTEKAQELIKILSNKGHELYEFNMIVFLMNFDVGNWNLCDPVFDLLEKTPVDNFMAALEEHYFSDPSQRTIDQICKLVDESTETSPAMKGRLEFVKQQEMEVHTSECPTRMKRFLDFTESEVLEWVEEHKIREKPAPVTECLAIITRTIQLKTENKKTENKIMLRHVQIFSVLSLWHNTEGALIQVGTGEGKSFIGLAFSILKVLHKEKVDIITSSPVLAERDADDEENQKIIATFGFTIGHNCIENSEQRKQVYAGADIIYGSLSYFQRDYLLTEFYNDNFMSSHRFDNVLVDEVDSMLLDKGNNILYLSQGLPDIDEIESVFVYIWQWVNQSADTNDEMIEILKTETVRKVILDQMFGLITEDDIASMLPKEFQTDSLKVFRSLVAKGLIDSEGIVLKEAFKESEIDYILLAAPTLPKLFSDRLKFCFSEKIEKEKTIKIPKYLQNFVLLHLNKWIESAVRALFMENEKQYIIDRSKTGTMADYDPSVIILDLSTGVDQVNSQWDEGLHQFLQLKHGCKLTLLSLKSVFISNVSFFKIYKKLYGMTGTLGSLQERQKLTEIHELDYMTVPTYIPKKFSEREAIILQDEMEWLEAIKNEIISVFEEKRSCLVICETINDIKNVRKFIGNDNNGEFSSDNVHIYQRDYEKFDVGKLPQRHVIIASNLAGRGTDIKLSELLKEAGGLHVILTYLPSNVRTELQAFGRAARAGAMGSARLVIVSAKVLPITDLKFQRDELELQRLNEIATFYKQFITIEERFFGQFQQAYKNFDESGEIKNLYLENFLIQWSFWLDENSQYLEEWNSSDNQSKVSDSFEKFIRDFKNFELQFHPSLTLKKFRHFDQNKDSENARNALKENFNDSSPAFHYYNVYIELKLAQKNNNFKNRPLKTSEEKLLRKAVEVFETRAFDRLVRKMAMDPYIEKYRTTLIPINGLEQQNNVLKKLEDHYIDSLQDLLGKSVYPETFESPLLVNKMLQKELYDHIAQHDVIDWPKVSNFYEEATVKKLAKTHSLDESFLLKFLNSRKGSPITSIDNFVEIFQESFWMPSREEFWGRLLQIGILGSEKQFAVIDLPSLVEFDPSEQEKLPKPNLKRLEPMYLDNPDNNFSIFLYSVSEDNEALTETDTKALFDLSEFRIPKFELFQEQKIFTEHKRAIFSKDEFSRPKVMNFIGFWCEIENDLRIFGAEGKAILERLVEQDILIPIVNSTFFHINAQNIDSIDLGENSVYQQRVLEILTHKFAYAIALEKLKKEVKSRNADIVISLPSNPHLSFVLDLLSNGIMEPSKANKEKAKNFKNLYKDEFLKEELLDLMKGRIPNSDLGDDLISELKTRDIIEEKYPPRPTPLYKIKYVDINKKNFKVFKPYEATIKLILQNRRTIIEKREEIQNKIDENVQGLSRKEFDNPEIILKSIDEFAGDEKNSEELYVMKLKGFDDVVQIQQKKYSATFWLRFFLVIIIGLAQIAIGVAITVLTFGMATNIGKMLIDEGFGDIVFALSQLRKGHFKWSDYGQHKKDSLITAVIMFGAGFIMSKVKYLKNFFKMQPLIGSATSATRMAAFKSVGKTLLVKTVESLSKVAVKLGVEALVESALPNLMTNISNYLADLFQKDFWKHEIQNTIDELLKYCTPEKTSAIIDNKIDEHKQNLDHINKLIIDIKEQVDSLIGMGESVSKWIALTSKVLGTSTAVIAMSVYISKSLDVLNEGLLDELRLERNQTSEIKTVTKEESDKVKERAFEKLGTILSNQLNDVLSKNILTPMLTYAGTRIVNKSVSKIGDMPWMKNGAKVKAALDSLLKNLSRADILRKLYNEYKVQKIMSKTASPELFSMLCTVDVPMNSFGIEAATTFLRESVDMNIRIIVTHEGVGTVFGKSDGTVVRLMLKDEEFENSSQKRFGYDCFYHSLDDHIPGFSNAVSAEQFRKGISDLFLTSATLRKAMQTRGTIRPVVSEANIDISNSQSAKYKEFIDTKITANDLMPSGSSQVLAVANIDHRVPSQNGRFQSVNFKTHNRQRATSVQSALDNINTVFFKYFDSYLELSEFEVTSWSKVLVKFEGRPKLVLYPVEFEVKDSILMDKIEASDKRTGVPEISKLRISIRDPTSKEGKVGPNTSHVGYEIVTSGTKSKGGHVLFNNVDDDITPPSRLRGQDSDELTAYFLELTKLFDPHRDQTLDEFYFSQERHKSSLTAPMPDGNWMIQQGILKV